MTCCSALKNLIAAWLNPPSIGLQPRPPSDFIWPRKDGVMRCSLCGAEFVGTAVCNRATATQLNPKPEGAD